MRITSSGMVKTSVFRDKT